MTLITVPLSKAENEQPVGVTVVHTYEQDGQQRMCPSGIKLLQDIYQCRGLVPCQVECEVDLANLVPVRLCDKCKKTPTFAIWNGYTEDGEPAWVEDPFPDAQLQARLSMSELYLYVQLSDLLENLFPCQKGEL